MSATELYGLPAAAQTVAGVAESLGVDPRLALADAQQESGLDPTAVGDQGTSFGLFQLHQGGELGNLTASQAFNPQTNATVALSEFAAVEQANPGITDPGTIAALAERPANPGAYAASVDAIYNNSAFYPSIAASPTATLTSTGPVTRAVEGTINAVTGGAAGAVAAAAGAVFGDLSSGIGKDALSIGLTIVFTLAGLGLIALGLARLFPGVSSTITRTIPLAAAA